MLVNIALMNILMSLNFLILNNFTIGSAIVLNSVAVLQTVINYLHEMKDEKPAPIEKIIFTVLYLGGETICLICVICDKPRANERM